MKVKHICLFSLIIIAGCNKDKAATKPKLKVISVSPTVLTISGETANTELEFTDKQGDLGSGILTIVINRLNVKKFLGPTTDTLRQTLPDFPNTSNGFIEAYTFYDVIKKLPPVGGLPYPDTVMLRFCVKDQAGNISDTVNSETVIAQ